MPTFRASIKSFLSFTSLLEIHVLIWSRSRCSFLISFFKSTSYFSFWLCCDAAYTYIQMHQNHPVDTHEHGGIGGVLKHVQKGFAYLVPNLIEDFDALFHLFQGPLDFRCEAPTSNIACQLERTSL